MFRSLTPQKVCHSSGYVIQVFDRYHVEYIDGSKVAKVEVDFGPIVGIYRTSLQQWDSGELIYDKDKEIILDRIAKGLQFMGSRTEIC